MEWSDELSCHVREIDDQHRRLVGMLNDLHRAMLKEEGQAALEDALCRMLDYTAYHFCTEEARMALHLYPGFQAHAAEHREFVHQVTLFQERLEARRMGVPVDDLGHLGSWLRHHIMGSDKALGPFFNSQGPCGHEACQA